MYNPLGRFAKKNYDPIETWILWSARGHPPTLGFYVFPPITTIMDIRPFIKCVMRKSPNTEIRIMQINEIITI
jgi:hypothetical protein